MSANLPVEVIITNLVALQDSYAATYRATITKERHQTIPWQQVYASFLECEVLHEPLLEHVGHLPIIAAYLHPLIAHSAKLDLGKSLIMLAVHDIGETVTGDIPSFAKNGDHELEEREAVKTLLSGDMLQYFDEYEENQSLEAKFAKSVDLLSPMLHHLSHTEVAAVLYQHLNADLIKLWERKRQYMEWDPVLLKIFDHCAKTILPTLLHS